MYEQFFNLRERPFDLTANPRFLFLTAGHREALSTLQYGIGAHKGITLLLGEAGTGKTTMLRAAIEQLRTTSARTVYLSNPTLTRSEFLEVLADGFGLEPELTRSKPRLLARLMEVLLERRSRALTDALVIDEAQSMPHELLEEVRLLSNLEVPAEKLLPVVLTGQPELVDRLNDSSLRQLKQRIALRCTLQPLQLKEAAAYISKRIHIAGGNSAELFTREAVQAIYERSRGIPRTINVICDNALVSAFALDRKPVDAEIVAEVCRDFDLLGVHGDEPAATGALPPANGTARTTAGVRAATAPRPAEATSGSTVVGAVARQAGPGVAAGAVPQDGNAAGDLPLTVSGEPPDVEPASATKPVPGEYFKLFTKRRRFSFF